jgi:Glycosyl hydrolase family 47
MAHSFNGWGLSIVDSLDTMWLMGLYEHFDGGLAAIANVTFSMPPVRILNHVIELRPSFDVGRCF